MIHNQNILKKRLAIIGKVGVPANYGSFKTLTKRLVKNLAQKYDITVNYLWKKTPNQSKKKYMMKQN